MSEENVETAKRGYEAWNRGDMEGMLEIFHPDLEYVTSGLFPGLDPVYRGHEGWKRFWRDFRTPWESLVIDAKEFRDAGDRVVVLFEFRAMGRDGVEVHRAQGNVLSFRDGLVVRLEAHQTWDSALEVAGLSE